MAKSARSRAEQHFTASQKKDKQDLKEREKAWQDKLDPDCKSTRTASR